MLNVRIPGFGTLGIAHLVLDYNGTLALDGRLLPRLGASRVAAIGNGRNDRLMLRDARIGVVVVQADGASSEALAAGDLVLRSVNDALDLFLRPERLTASLRA
jgi:soluble P-type ATPase